MQKKMNLKNGHCEEAPGRRGNLLPLAVREPFIFSGAQRSNLICSKWNWQIRPWRNPSSVRWKPAAHAGAAKAESSTACITPREKGLQPESSQPHNRVFNRRQIYRCLRLRSKAKPPRPRSVSVAGSGTNMILAPSFM